MSRLRSQSGPIVKCAFAFCQNHFRKWGKRLFCCDKCRKQAWKVAHRPYYAKLRQQAWHKKKLENRHTGRYRWVEEGKEDEAPEYITMIEALAQATPDEQARIQEILSHNIEE